MYCNCIQKQESSAGNRKRRTVRGITCPSINYLGRGLGEGVPQSWPGEGGTPVLARGYPSLAGGGCYPYPGVILGRDLGPVTGVLPRRDLGPVTGVPPRNRLGTSHWGAPRKDKGPVEVLWNGDGVCAPPPSLQNRQTN